MNSCEGKVFKILAKRGDISDLSCSNNAIKPRESELRERIIVPSFMVIIWIYFKFARMLWLFLSVVSVTRAVYFHVNVTCFTARHLNLDTCYSKLSFFVSDKKAACAILSGYVKSRLGSVITLACNIQCNEPLAGKSDRKECCICCCFFIQTCQPLKQRNSFFWEPLDRTSTGGRT